MIDFLNNIDTQIFLLFNNTLRLPALDNFMMLFSGKFIWVPMYASLLYIMIKSFTPRQVLLYVAAIALTITLADQTCATLIRPAVERLRPSNLDNPLSALTIVVNDYRGGSYGFPSCHAANSFALAVFSSLLLRRRRFTVFIFTWAAFNSFTRIHLGVHYPGDLLVGALIGSGFGYLCYRGAMWVNHIMSSSAKVDSDGNDIVEESPILLQISDFQSRAVNIRAFDAMIATGAATALCIVIAAIV